MERKGRRKVCALTRGKKGAPDVCKGSASTGSFRVASRAISFLLENKATKLQVCGFLVLCRFHDKKHKYGTSSAGHESLQNYIGIGKTKSKEIVEQLSSMGLIGEGPNRYEAALDRLDFVKERTTEAEYEVLLKDCDKYKRIVKRQARWILPSRGNEIWISNGLVDETCRPLNLLYRRTDDLTARILCLLYRSNDIALNAINAGCYFEDNDQSIGIESNGFVILSTSICPEPTVNKFFMQRLLGIDDLQDQFEYSSIAKSATSSLRTLEKLGFIYKVVTVEVFENNELVCSYELDIKASDIKHSRKNRPTMFADQIKRLAMAIGFTEGRKDNRFYNNYYLVLPEGMSYLARGYYRLRHTVTNSRNYPVRKAEQQRKDWNAMVADWIRIASPQENC